MFSRKHVAAIYIPSGRMLSTSQMEILTKIKFHAIETTKYVIADFKSLKKDNSVLNTLFVNDVFHVYSSLKSDFEMLSLYQLILYCNNTQILHFIPLNAYVNTNYDDIEGVLKEIDNPQISLDADIYQLVFRKIMVPVKVSKKAKLNAENILASANSICNAFYFQIIPEHLHIYIVYSIISYYINPFRNGMKKDIRQKEYTPPAPAIKYIISIIWYNSIELVFAFLGYVYLLLHRLVCASSRLSSIYH